MESARVVRVLTVRSSVTGIRKNEGERTVESAFSGLLALQREDNHSGWSPVINDSVANASLLQLSERDYMTPLSLRL